ncbi:MAG: sensor histidine kinase [Gemmatimonadaceae bacterium]
MQSPSTAPGAAWRVRPWMLVSAAWIVPAILGGLDAMAQQSIWGNTLDVRAILFTALDWLIYGFLTPFVFLLARRFPLSRPNVRRHVVIQIVFALLFCAVWAGIGTLLKVALQPNSFGRSVARFYTSWIFTTLPFGVAVYLAMVGIEHAIRYFVEARERDAVVARLSGQLSSARLAALQAQLNPHFLFNSLNTIAVLVRDGNATMATRVIEQLSDVLRSTLSRSRDSEVSLDDELELVRQYLAVEQARFSDRMRAEFDVDPSLLSAAVPSFALQHLVENAVRHGIARRSNAGLIAVTARRDGDMLELSVSDDGGGFMAGAADVAGHGLDNTRERLLTLYGTNASLEVMPIPGGGTVARLRIPYRESVLEARHEREP